MDLLQRLLYTAVGALSLFYLFVKSSLSHWQKRGILHEKPKFLWGNLKGVGSKRHISAALNDIYENYKGKAPFIGFYAWLKPLAFVLDIELARHILMVDAAHFQERGIYHNVQYDAFTENLIQLDGQEYKNLYKRMAPCFTEARLKSMFPTLLRVANNFNRVVMKQHRKSDIFNINELVNAYNTDVVALIAFGLETDTLTCPNTEFCRMSKNFLNNISFFKMYLAWCFPNLACTFGFRMYNLKATAYFQNLIKKQLELRTEKNRVRQTHPDFLEYFVESKLLENSNESSECIAAQCFSWILAGLEASNTTLTMCLYELSLNLDVQNKARTEIERIITQHKNEFTLECLNDMVYLKQTLYETLRKHTPYPFLLRNTVKEYEIPNSIFMLQEGNSIIIPIRSIHNDPEIYVKPQNFDPTRFDPSIAKVRNPAAFLPFGLGPKSCLIREFTEMQMLVCLVTILLEYQITSCSQTPILLQYDLKKLIVTPKTQIRLRLERISKIQEIFSS